MELHKYAAHELRDMMRNKKVSAQEVTEAFINRIEYADGKLGTFLYIAKKEALKKAVEVDKKINNGEELGELAGIPIAIKDNISIKGMQNSCGSKILEGYISPYDAEVIVKLKKEDAILIGKTNMDEFAMGSSSENSAFKVVRNPWNIETVSGGSSGGSAAVVAACEAPLALGTETGGSVRQPASFCGVVGLKPTYGRISRYGVTAFASTLDQVGSFGKDVEDCAILTKAISGVDYKDSTTVKMPVQDYSKYLKKDIRGIKIGIPKEFFGKGLNDQVRETVEEAIKVLKENGAEIKECSLPLSEYALAVYHIIASAEASSNLARFDGIKYGYRSKKYDDISDLYYKTRSEGFGKEVKRRIMLGTYALSAGYYDAYYKKALKVRNLIKQDFERVFKDFDAIVSPTSPTTAFKFGERRHDPVSMYLSDIYTVPVNTAGIPAISLPCGVVDGLPVGLQLMSNYFREDILFNIAYSYEQSTEWHNNIADI